MRRSILVFALLLVAAVGMGFKRSSNVSFLNYASWQLCVAEDDDDAICDDSGTDRAAVVSGYKNLLVSSASSDSTSYTCDIFGGGYEVVEANAVDLSTSGFQLNSVSLSQTVEAISFSDIPVDVVWIKCNTIGNNTVTITVTGSK